MSATIKGAGLLNGSIYSSSYGDAIRDKGQSEAELATLETAAVEKAKAIAVKREAEGLIDPLSNLKDAPVFVNSGMNDKSMPVSN